MFLLILAFMEHTALLYEKSVIKGWKIVFKFDTFISSIPLAPLFAFTLLSDSTSQWTPLSFANSSPLSGTVRDFHPQVVAHAGHTNELANLLKSASSFFKFLVTYELMKLSPHLNYKYRPSHLSEQASRNHWNIFLLYFDIR